MTTTIKNEEAKYTRKYILDVLKKKVDLSDFLETEIGCHLKWYKDNEAGMICPMPHHKDSKPSFRIKKTEDGVWIYHCLGCGSHGTIINFCQDYYSLQSLDDVINIICEKCGYLKNSKDFVFTVNDIKKKYDSKKMAEFAHISVANQCRILLRKNYDLYNIWVGKAYKKMNEALDSNDVVGINKIGDAVFKKLGEQCITTKDQNI